MDYFKFKEVEVIVVGGGHAGIEAACAASKLHKKTILITMSLDSVANMPCNPSIGGTAKGQLVKELDALGGRMGVIADRTSIQSRILNRKKGPAVHSLREQIDRNAYHIHMKNLLDFEQNLLVLQDEVVNLKIKNGKVYSVITRLNLEIKTKAVILSCGTFLNSKIFIGDFSSNLGPDNLSSSKLLAHNLEYLGIKLKRFKTGTSARVKKNSLNFSKFKIQIGEENLVGFSTLKESILENKVNCYIAATNEKTHEVILNSLSRAPIYSGKIEGIGPRYCPSIEDKVVRFKNKKSHQFFIEPIGLNSGEFYLQGLSSSLPFDIQIKFLKTIEGFEDVEIMRPAYAIEYCCCNSLDLYATLEFKQISGLYGAGQFNGTSGYEEAAVQGFVAGVNAALKIDEKEPLILTRSNSFIGTLIDDLTIKGCEEPYRMMTARSEHRLFLRQDNADYRLTKIGFDLGLVDEDSFQRFLNKQEQIEKELDRLKHTMIKPSVNLNTELKLCGLDEISTSQKFSNLLKRPNLNYETLIKFDLSENKPVLSPQQIEHIEIELKYEGYVKKQRSRIENSLKLEKLKLPSWIDYDKIIGLKTEAKQQLKKIKPFNLEQASRIFGVNPSDVSIIMVWLKKHGHINQ